MSDFAQPRIGDSVTLTRSRLGQYVHLADDAILEEVEMGDYSYTAGHNQIFYATIGKFVSIASYARINPGNHPTYQRIAQHHFTYRASEYDLGEDDEAFFDWRREHHVTIGHDVWIGHNAIVMPGVSIGNGAVIGSAAVVTKDVAPYEIVAGVAAKKIGMRFDDALIERIERSQCGIGIIRRYSNGWQIFATFMPLQKNISRALPILPNEFHVAANNAVA